MNRAGKGRGTERGRCWKGRPLATGVLMAAFIPLVSGALASCSSSPPSSVSESDRQEASSWVQHNPQMWSWTQEHWDEMALMYQHWDDVAWMRANLPDFAWMRGHWDEMTWMRDHWSGMEWMHQQMMGSPTGGMMGQPGA